MTFKAYLVNIEAKTGRSPDDLFTMATKEGFIEGGKIVASHSELLLWLKRDVGLGHGHANAIILYLRLRTNDPKVKETASLEKRMGSWAFT